MIVYKDILQKLKAAGYNTSDLRKQRLISEASINNLRKGKDISMSTLNVICRLTNLPVEAFIVYEPDSYSYDTWEEALVREITQVRKFLAKHQNIKAARESVKNYDSLFQIIRCQMQQCRKHQDVRETLSYTDKEWEKKIDEQLQPVAASWLKNIGKQAAGRDAEYQDYVLQFWNNRE